MSVKKLLVLSAAGLASILATAALAGGPEVMPVPDYSGVYIQGDIGWANVRWRYYYPGLGFNNNSNGSGFTAGGSIGYQWSRYLAAEFGGYWIANQPRFNNAVVTPTGAVVFNNNGRRVSDWFLYLAGKIMAPMPWICMDNLDVFFKAGAAYRPININGSRNACGPLFGAGLQYWICPTWYVKGQWLYVGDMGRRVFFNRFQGNIPPINLFTLGVGYKFQL